MRAILRGDDDGVASAVATILALVVVLIFLQIMVIAVVPQQQFTAEYTTSLHNLGEFDFLRSLLAGPALGGTQFSVPFRLGTPAVSPFGTASDGLLSMSADEPTQITTSFGLIANLRQAAVRKVDQNVVLLMDDSGSMAWNDPLNLRITGAQQYVGQLSPPDCTAIVAFNGRAYLTQANVGGPVHHLTSPGMCGNPNYAQAQADLGTISDIDSTNIGAAIATGNTELTTYGNRNTAWVEILLTDGQNECGGSVPPCGNAYTLQMAGVAKANNITIFTIGLSNQADSVLLTQIASITGGTYYAAPTASSIRWIYFEIAMHYQSNVYCGNVVTSDSYSGALSLQLGTSQYPRQTIRFESGAIAVNQSDGTVLFRGLPMQYTALSKGSGAISLSLIGLVGKPFQAQGTGTAVVGANVMSRQLQILNLTQIDLATESNNVGSIEANVTYWANAGAATPAAAAAVNQPLSQAQGSLSRAAVNASKSNVIGAGFDTQRAQSQLSIAINVTESQRTQGAMQNWLAKQTEDSIILESCRVAQWQNWYNGLQITIVTPEPTAWAIWANQTFAKIQAPFSYGVSKNTIVITINALNQITTDRRVVSLSVS